MMSPVPVQLKSTSTLKSQGSSDTKSNPKHSNAAFNVAESRFWLTWKSWSANGPEGKQSAARSCAKVQSFWKIIIWALEDEPPGPGGLCNLSSVAKANTPAKIHVVGSLIQLHPVGFVVLKKAALADLNPEWMMSPDQAVVGRLRAARIKAKTTPTNFVTFFLWLSPRVIFNILFILVSSLCFLFC